jgi:hypothetical protein
MAIVLSSAVRDAMLNALDDYVNTGSGQATIEFQTASSVEVATLILNDPAFDPASGGSMALNTTSDVKDTGATGNATNVSKFVLKNQNGDTVITGSLAIDGSGDINLNTLTIPANAVVQIDSLTIVAPNP